MSTLAFRVFGTHTGGGRQHQANWLGSMWAQLPAFVRYWTTADIGQFWR